MKSHRVLRSALFSTGLLAAAALSAQFVSLSRCHAAYPCAIPFGLQYRPDRLIAGQYGRVPDSAISLRVPLKAPLVPELDKRSELDFGAMEAAVRKSLEIHPPPGSVGAKPDSEKRDTKPAAPRTP